MGNRQQTLGYRAPYLRASAVRPYLAMFYISVVWLTYCFNVPIDVFEGVPLYVLLTPLMFFVLPEAIVPGVMLSLALLGYECLKFIQPEFEPTAKGFLGIAILAPILAVCYYSLAAIRTLPDQFIGAWLRALLYIFLGAMLVTQVLGFTGISTTDAYPHYFLPIQRRSGLVTEPSFVALWISPYLFMIAHNFTMFRRYLGVSSLLAVLAIMVLCPSATLTGVAMLSVGIVTVEYLLRGRAVGLLGSSVALIAVAGIIIALPDVVDRVNGVLGGGAARDENMSSLIFIKGQQMAGYALFNIPLGVSFQNMASLVPHADVAYYNKTIWQLNSDDGSSILFKGICELGILFVLVACVALWRFLKNIVADPGNSMFTILVLAFQFTAFAHFLRGSSYFDGVVAIGLAICVFDSFTNTLVDLRVRASRRKALPAPGTTSRTAVRPIR